MTRAQRSRRVFNIDITSCEECVGAVKVIAEMSDRSIEDPAVIGQMPEHLEKKWSQKNSTYYPRAGHRPKQDCSGSQRNQFDSVNSPKLLRVKVAADSWHARWLKYDRIDRLEGAILDVPVGIGQISGSPGPDDFTNSFLCLLE